MCTTCLPGSLHCIISSQQFYAVSTSGVSFAQQRKLRHREITWSVSEEPRGASWAGSESHVLVPRLHSPSECSTWLPEQELCSSGMWNVEASVDSPPPGNVVSHHLGLTPISCHILALVAWILPHVACLLVSYLLAFACFVLTT